MKYCYVAVGEHFYHWYPNWRERLCGFALIFEELFNEKSHTTSTPQRQNFLCKILPLWSFTVFVMRDPKVTSRNLVSQFCWSVIYTVLSKCDQAFENTLNYQNVNKIPWRNKINFIIIGKICGLRFELGHLQKEPIPNE